MNDYPDFAARAAALGITDPWCLGDPRLSPHAVVLTPTHARELAQAAEGIAAVHDELVHLVTAEPALLDSFFVLSPWQRLLAQASLPHWHGLARADVFLTADGARVCELNCDTPSGQPEAVHLSALAARDHGLRDPNAALPVRFRAMLTAHLRRVGTAGPATIGIVYPTELTEDLAMVALYRDWLQHAGHRVVLGSPFNLTMAPDGRIAVLDEPCDLLLRHYKTDWWCERLPVRDDEELAQDRDPLGPQLAALLQADLHNKTAVVNPFGALLPQNKRSLAFCWEQQDRFSARSRQAIARWLPPTRRLEHVRDELWHQREHWVLKSDYGCEGDEVIVGALVDQEVWEDALAHAIAQRWVAQRHFAATADADGQVVNHGVYLVGGRTAGWLLRRHPATTITDTSARCAGALLAEDHA
ncbi:MAG: glutathionylspermidine synthase family protein [Planctomycetes bacterium]|nr:glutathionylspermidine synthase family protein [Planctomycetota bacterium]